MVVPILEILIFVKLGKAFGFWNTLLVVIGAGLLGAMLARFEGLRSWSNFQKALQKKEMPGEHVVDAVIIYFAGILLIIPGLLTDLAGIFLLIPWTRFFVKRWLRLQFDRMIHKRDISRTHINYYIR